MWDEEKNPNLGKRKADAVSLEGLRGVSTDQPDTTKRFLQSLQGYPEELQQGWPTAPKATELAHRMQGQLMCKDGTMARLPVHDKLYRKLVAADPDMTQVLQPVSQSGAEALATFVSTALDNPMAPPDDKVVLAGYVDQLVWRILELAARTLRTQRLTRKRNSTEHSLTSPKLKPDFLLLVRQSLLMKGEDKTAAEDLPLAKQELRDTLKQWSARHHGRIEYLLCYAAAGLHLQFCAVGRETPTPELLDLGPEWDISQVYNRVRVIMCTLMLFPVLMHQLAQLPSMQGLSVRGLCQTVTSSNGTAITFWDDCVEKTVDLRLQPLSTLPPMALVYEAAKGCPQLIQLRQDTHVAVWEDTYRVFLVPIGTELSTMRPPQGLELRHAIRCVLMAVKWLHQRGWGHGDIRWENIISETKEAYRLIDLECAVRLGTNCAARWPAPHAWGEQCEALVQGRFTQESDLFMVGKLMQVAAPGPEGQALMTALLDKTISVDAALSSSWFETE